MATAGKTADKPNGNGEAPKTFTATLKAEKQCQGSVRYMETLGPGQQSGLKGFRPANIYIPREALTDLGNPDTLTITVAVA